MRASFATLAVGTLLILGGAGNARAQHDADIRLVASGPSAGQILALADFDAPILVQQGFCAGGLCLYSGTDPGFVTPSPAPASTFAIASGTALQVQLVAIDTGASMKIGTTVLDAAGESAALGSASSVHVHPSWQITAASGAMLQKNVSFRIIAPGGTYATSPEYTLTLSTFAATTTTTIATSTTTTTTIDTATTSTSVPTTTLEPYCGDGLLDPQAEDCDNGPDNGRRGTACTAGCAWGNCGDADHSGTTTVGDALHVLRVAVGTADCATCLCDVRRTSPNQFAATDALHLLRKAIGMTVTLECPPCE